MIPQPQISQPNSRGFTLLEVVLALALSALLFMGLGLFAMWQSQLLENRYRTITDAQIARVVLEQIGRDLRNVAVAASSDASSAAGGDSADSAASSLSSGSSTSSGSQGNSATAGTGSSTTSGSTTSGSSSTGTSSDAAANTTGDLTTSQAVPTVPGIYGTTQQLLVDTQHVPTFQERITAAQWAAAGQTGVSFADVQTVLYHVSLPNDSVGATVADAEGTLPSPHLLRHAVPRAQAVWQAELGGLGQLWMQANSYATAVRALECWYYDGTQWLTQWDTATAQRLPVAVQVLIWVDSSPVLTTEIPSQLRDAATSNVLAQSDVGHLFSTVVTFRANPSATTAMAATGDGSTSTSNTTTSNSSNSGTAGTGTTSSAAPAANTPNAGNNLPNGNNSNNDSGNRNAGAGR